MTSEIAANGFLSCHLGSKSNKMRLGFICGFTGNCLRSYLENESGKGLKKKMKTNICSMLRAFDLIFHFPCNMNYLGWLG